ncbi:MAG: efflux RND transporter periplasmic adaptor subunit [Gemmatimonadetes bacterium]|nr:efflux RND transporter periplasmic adaptor subunit [Gemmatimonadota bacterium]
MPPSRWSRSSPDGPIADLVHRHSEAVQSSDDSAPPPGAEFQPIPPDQIRQIEESGEIRKTVTFRSPVSGVVIEKSVLAGQRLMAGEAVYRYCRILEHRVAGRRSVRAGSSSVRPCGQVVAEFLPPW